MPEYLERPNALSAQVPKCLNVLSAQLPKCLSALSVQVPKCLKVPKYLSALRVPECHPSARVLSECSLSVQMPECSPSALNVRVPSECL